MKPDSAVAKPTTILSSAASAGNAAETANAAAVRRVSFVFIDVSLLGTGGVIPAVIHYGCG